LLCIVVACSKEQVPDDVQSGALSNQTDSIATTDTLVNEVDTAVFAVTDSTITLKRSEFPQPGGRVVNVMITGVDSRLGDYGAHADANHLVRFFLDSAMVEIISIPRDTYADAGFDDTTNLNKLANVRAVKGRHAYLAAVSEITGVSPINHWVEFGFSQAVGLLEMLGYKDNATSTLRVLRSRQAYKAGDFQRSYNQGRFIRSALLKRMADGTSFVNSIALRAGLMMVETNLTYDVCSGIVDQMNSHGFDASPKRVWVRLEPQVLLRVQAFEFDSSNIIALDKQIEQRVAHLLKDSSKILPSSYEHQLDKLIRKADSTRKGGAVVRLLRRPYEQRAWLQVTDHARRSVYRERLCGRLEQAYRSIGNVKQANAVKQYAEEERKALGQ